MQDIPVSASLPNFLPRRTLHQRLKPNLVPRAFDNWLARAMAKSGFPAPVRLGARSVAWDEQAVLRWIQSRPRGGIFDGKRGRQTRGIGGEAA
jgi:hypothetical protein